MKTDIEQFRAWLLDNLNHSHKQYLIDNPDVIYHWLNDLDDNGHIEIGIFESATGRPVTGIWPELTPTLTH